MKNVILTTALTILFFSSNAQFTKGTKLVGGTLGASFTNADLDSQSSLGTDSRGVSLSIQPQGGYFVLDRFALGAGIQLTTGSQKNLASDSRSSSIYVTVSPFARYYLNKFFGQVQFGIGSGKSKFESPVSNSETRFARTESSAAIGYALKLTESVAIEPMFGYSSSSSTTEFTDGSEQTDHFSGFYFRVGLQVYVR